ESTHPAATTEPSAGQPTLWTVTSSPPRFSGASTAGEPANVPQPASPTSDASVAALKAANAAGTRRGGREFVMGGPRLGDEGGASRSVYPRRCWRRCAKEKAGALRARRPSDWLPD